ncbi:MAG: hypothetical protein WCK36_01505, partial [Candidatus Firestonebacteria bacterium]
GGRTCGDDDVFMPTEYDSDAPLSETGRLTKKFLEFAKVNYALRGLKTPEIKIETPKLLPKLPEIKTWKAFNPVIGTWRKLGCFESFEKQKRYLGYGVYRAIVLSKAEKLISLYFTKYGDRIKIFANGKYSGTFGRGAGASKIPVEVALKKGSNELLFFTDNMGRFNYSLGVGEQKGIFGPVYMEAKSIKPVWAITKTGEFKFIADKIWDTEIYSAGGALKKALPGLPLAKRKFILAKATFTGKAGKKYFSEFVMKDSAHKSFFLNGVQIYYARNSHITGGIMEFDITKYIKEGANTLEIYHEKSSDYEFLKTCRLIECSEELQGSLSFAEFETLAEGRARVLKPFKIWKTSFVLDRPEFPVRLRMDGMGKGQIYLNGINIGRYWQPKPQRDYYLPEPWLKGKNELVLFEEEGKLPNDVKLVYDSKEAFIK